MRKVAFVLLFASAAMLGGQGATAQPQGLNLSPSATPVPSQPYLAGYGNVLTTVFKDAFAPTVRLRMLAMPAFENESVVGIKEENGQFTVFFEQAGKRLWNYPLLTMFKNGSIIATGRDGKNRNAEEVAVLTADLPWELRDVRLERCEAKIDATLAQDITSLWTIMVARATPGGSDSGLDGDEYYFSTPERAGTAWSPPLDSNDGMLVEIASQMRRYCKQLSLFRGLVATSLRRQVDALTVRLKQ